MLIPANKAHCKTWRALAEASDNHTCNRRGDKSLGDPVIRDEFDGELFRGDDDRLSGECMPGTVNVRGFIMQPANRTMNSVWRDIVVSTDQSLRSLCRCAPSPCRRMLGFEAYALLDSECPE